MLWPWIESWKIFRGRSRSLKANWKVFFSSLAIALKSEQSTHLSKRAKIAADCSAYARVHYNEHDLTVERIADHLGVSTRHLLKSFKAETDKGVRQFIIDIRLKKARDLLRTGRFSVKEVAFLTGWKNPNYFSTRFQRRYGVAPSELNEA